MHMNGRMNGMFTTEAQRAQRRSGRVAKWQSGKVMKTGDGKAPSRAVHRHVASAPATLPLCHFATLPLILLREKRGARQRGFTIIEVIVIVVILGIIAAVIAPRLIGRIGQSKQTVAAANAASLVTAMKSFQMDHYAPRPGDTIDILWERPSDVADTSWDPYVDNADALLDPWGRKYVLIVPGNRNVDFDIVSYGRDGSPGGEGEDADIVKP
jgi:general secretion pathway protein G